MSYNRRKVLRALGKRGVIVLREGGGHTVVQAPSGRQSSLPRHPQLDRHMVRGIVKQLDLNWDDIREDLA